MPTTIETIRKITVQGQSVGVKETTADLTALSRAQTSVAQTAEGMAVSTDSSAKRQLSSSRAYDSVRQRVDEVYRAQVQQQKMQLTVQRAYDQGSISADEFARTSALVAQHFAKSSAAANDNAKATGLARHELINLSRQAQDVAVSLAGGMSPLMVLMQQGSQIGDVFASSRGTIGGFFQQAISWAGGFLTAGRLAFGGVTAGITAGVMALNSYLAAQKQVQAQLFGAGRASGATTGSINAAASAGSSAFGLSVSEARELAGTLASTGRVANDNILPIVKMGHDIATVFGIDAKEAAKLLADAFADPVRGAEMLNQRLGFLDAATQTNIRNLVEQNRTYEAQRILVERTAESLKGANEVVSLSAMGWTFLSNQISNAWDGLGKFVARSAGIQTLEERVKAAREELALLEAAGERGARQRFAMPFSQTLPQVTAEDTPTIRAKREALAELTKELDNNRTASIRAAAAQQTFLQVQTIRSLSPEITEQERMNNQLKVLEGLLDSLANNEAAGAMLKALGVSMEQIAAAIAKARTQIADFKTDTQKIQAGNAIALDAASAFSPAARADIARRQAELQYSGNPDKAKLAQDAYNISLKQSVVALSEVARERELSTRQGVEGAQLEASLVGRSIAQQTELRMNLQLRQQMEQEAARNRTTIDEAQYQRLVKLNAEAARLAQLRAEKQLGSDIAFDRSQIGLTDSEQNANARIRSIYNDNLTSEQAQFYKQQLMVNEALRQTNDIGRDAFKGFAQDILASKNATEALQGALNKISSKLMDMAADSLWSSAFGGKGGLGGLLGGLFGGDTRGGIGVDPSMIGPVAPGFGYAAGGYTGPGAVMKPAGIVHAGEYVFSQASVNRLGLGYLDRLHRAGVRGYATGGAVMAAANTNTGGPAVVMQDNRTFHIGEGASQDTVAQLKAELERDRAERRDQTIAIVRKAQRDRRL